MEETARAPTTDEDGLPIRPLPDGSDVRRATAKDIPALSAALARAFYDDPVSSWVYRDDAKRLARLGRGFDLLLRRVYIRHDECYTTDRLAGGALWHPPGTWHLSPLEQLRLLPGIVGHARGDAFRALRFILALEAAHPQDPHYYLPFAGVSPEWQGRGFGSALIRPVLDRCDAEGIPAYLEASTARNRALYERHDFEVSGDGISAGGSPPMTPMWREPRG